MIELLGLNKVRERRRRLDDVVKEYGIKRESTKWQARAAFELKEAEQQFQSDFRAIEAELRNIIIDGVAYSTRIDNVIRAIHSAIGDER